MTLSRLPHKNCDDLINSLNGIFLQVFARGDNYLWEISYKNHLFILSHAIQIIPTVQWLLSLSIQILLLGWFDIRILSKENKNKNEQPWLVTCTLHSSRQHNTSIWQRKQKDRWRRTRRKKTARGNGRLKKLVCLPGVLADEENCFGVNLEKVGSEKIE